MGPKPGPGQGQLKPRVSNFELQSWMGTPGRQWAQPQVVTPGRAWAPGSVPRPARSPVPAPSSVCTCASPAGPPCHVRPLQAQGHRTEPREGLSPLFSSACFSQTSPNFWEGQGRDLLRELPGLLQSTCPQSGVPPPEAGEEGSFLSLPAPGCVPPASASISTWPVLGPSISPMRVS